MSFWQARTKIDYADRLFSKYVRLNAGNRCENCGAGSGVTRLECSHFFGRRKESTRFDPENCACFCAACHQAFENEKGISKGVHKGKTIEFPRAYRRWMIEKLGPVRFARLEVRAGTHVKRDRKMSMIYVKALMVDMENKKNYGVVGRKQ